ncbi:MAG: hypothetical protein JWN95_2694 [Frankiales bacterium]|nr:hypothetical protein [Frankiales bacterium]
MPDSIDDPPELAHFRTRLTRARQHYNSFGALWADYLDGEPHHLDTTIDHAGLGTVSVVEDEPIPDELAILLAEFLYQLRAALDNCLYAVAVIDSGQSPPPNAQLLEWPICLAEDKWQSSTRRLKALSPEILTALEAIQPYQADCPDWNCLRTLHDLARIDRHRALHLVTVYYASGRAKVDLDHVADFATRIGVVGEDRVVATFQWLTDETITPKHLDLDLVLEVDTADVTNSPDPVTGTPQRPWGSLGRRMQALVRAVEEYTEGLVTIAHEIQAKRRLDSPN